MKPHRLPRGTLSLPGTESADDFRLVLKRVRATSIPQPAPPGLAWLIDWGPLPSEDKAQADLDLDTCSQEDEEASDTLYKEMLDQ